MDHLALRRQRNFVTRIIVLSQSALHDWREPLSARTLALAFLSTSARAPLRAAGLIRRAEICGVDGSAMRMALSRLLHEDVIEQVERGVYAIGRAGLAIHNLARGWAAAEDRIRVWDGRWIIVAADHLGRTDRQRLRVRERAMRLGGFAKGPGGLWLRPDNLALALSTLAERLHAFGLDDAATVLGDARALDAEDAVFRLLWPRDAIEAGYRHWIAELAASEARLPTMPALSAARETLLLGQSVISAINRDPLLPDALVDADLRRAMVNAMRCYDAIGKGFWTQVGDP